MYLKLFLYTGIPYGIFMGIYYSYQGGIYLGCKAGLSSGLLFGCIMSLILGTLHWVFTKRNKSRSENNSTGVHHIRQFELTEKYSKVFEICIQSLEEIKKSKVITEDRRKGLIEAKTGITWKTFGDKIQFVLTKINEDCTKVEVSSRPAVRATLVDYGKNLENIQIIEASSNRNVGL